MNPVDTIISEAKRLLGLRDRKDELEEELKQVNKDKEHLEVHVLPKLMIDSEIEKMTIEDVGTLYTQGSVYAYIYAEQREEVHTWFKSQGHGDLVKESIHHATLKSFVKEQMEEGKEVPAFLNAKPITTARIRRK